MFWPKKSNKKVVIIKGEGPKEPSPPALELHHPQRILLEANMARPLKLDICTLSTIERPLGANPKSKYGETLDVIGCALNPQLRELLEQTFAAFSPPLCVRKTSICQNMKKFGERKILFLVSSSQSFDQKWQNSSPAKSPV